VQDKQDLKSVLRKQRLKLKFTLSDMSNVMGLMQPSSFANIECGKVGLPVKHIPKIAAKLQINVDLLQALAKRDRLSRHGYKTSTVLTRNAKGKIETKILKHK
jgi:transcriptional regulator with XRE-family HTH domain